jgi:hypothetical protein
MKDNRVLVEQINRCFKANAGKAVFSTGALLVSQMLIMFSLVVLLQLFPAILMLPLAMFAAISLFLVQYGFVTLLYKLYTGKKAIIGDLFFGFRDIRRIGKAALLFFFLDCAVFVLCVILIAVIASVFPGMELSRMIFTVFVIYGLLIVAVLLPFAFVWLELFANPNEKAPQVFKKSARKLAGQKRRLFALCFQSGGIFLVGALALCAFNFILLSSPIPDIPAFGIHAEAPKIVLPAGISAAFDIIYYIMAAVALIKVVFALAALYIELTVPDTTLQLPGLELPDGI